MTTGLIPAGDTARHIDSHLGKAYVFEAAHEIGLITSQEMKSLCASSEAATLAQGIPSAAFNVALRSGNAAERALQAIDCLFEPSDVVELRSVPDGRSNCGRLDVNAERQELLEFIRTHNGKNNIYFGCNPRIAELAGTTRPGNKTTIAGRRGIVFDLDLHSAPSVDPDWSKTVAALRKLGPALIVNSGNGYHIHFRLKGLGDSASAGAATAQIKSVMARLGADDMSDLPRIARLPFTVNIPNKSKIERGCQPAMAAPAQGKLPPHRERDFLELVETLEGLSDSLSLPSKGVRSQTAAATPQQMPSGSNAAAAGADKGHGGLAPSLAVLDLLLKHLPNDTQYDHYLDWLAIVTAVRGASWKQSWEDGGLVALQSWCDKWGGDPNECKAQWDRIKERPGLGWVRLQYELRTHNPNAVTEVKRAEAAATFTKDSLLRELLERVGNQSQNPARGLQLGSATSVKIAPMAAVSAKQIAPRKFLYGTSIIAGFISVLVAPGGTGKSALATAEAISMATGKTLFPHQAPHRPLTVWMHNAEDPKEEQQRRVVAALKHYDLSFAELGERLILTSGRDLPLILAKDGSNGAEPVRGTIEGLIKEMNANKVDVLVLDPLGATHTLPENDNSAANVLLGVLREICDRTGAAIVLVHHTSKAAGSDMSGAGANASRGASAIVDGARNVRQLVPMTKDEAAKLRVSEDDRTSLFRVANGKANLAPMSAATWRKLTTVALQNGTPDYPNGDSVAVVEAWEPLGPACGTEQDLKRVQDAMRAASEPYRLDQRSDNWIGHLIAEVLGLDIGASVTIPNRSQEQKVNRQYVQDVLKGWTDDGAIIAETTRDPRAGRDLKIVVVGRAARDASPYAPELASAFGDPMDGSTAPQSQKQTVARSGGGVKT